MAEEKKYRVVVIDTINQIQQDKYTELLKDKGKANYDDWRDYGVDIMDLYKYMRELPNEEAVIVQVLGYEGSGKTCGAMYLNPDEVYYLNSDKKQLTFTGARQKYPTDNSKKNYKVINSYEDAKSYIKGAFSRKKDGPFIIFVLAHIDDYKSADGVGQRQRMRILGRMATKNNIEGSVIHSYYTEIDPQYPFDSPERYRLKTVNTGFNTGRAPMGYFDTPSIANNYQTIVNKILEDWGIKPEEAEEK